MAKINYTYRPADKKKKKINNYSEVYQYAKEEFIEDKLAENPIDKKTSKETVEEEISVEEHISTEDIVVEDIIEEKKLQLDSINDNKGGLNMGQGSYQELIENQVIFALPPKDGVIEIANVKRTVEISKVDIITDNAIVKGFLHTSVLYNTVPRREGHSLKKDDCCDKDNRNEKDSRGDRDRDKSKDKEICDSLDKKFVVDGVVRHSNSWIPFEFLISIPGAKKGDKYKIEYAGVAQDAFVQTIIYDDEDCRVFGPQNKPFIKGFKEKDTVKVTITVY